MIKDFLISLSAFFLRIGFFVIGKTLKVKVFGTENLNENALYCFWHQNTFALFTANPIKKLAILTATEARGEIFTRVAEKFNLEITRTSYNEDPKAGASAFIKLVKKVKDGFSLGIALDGPKGPLHVIKPGIALLSKKTGKRIIPVGIEYSKRICLTKRWDKYFVPLPFSSVVLYLDFSYNGRSLEALYHGMKIAQHKAKSSLTGNTLK